MGLAGRKVKQRIGEDPRNLTWADDASRFGQQYLSKFGWTPDSGTGLGVNGQGRMSHLTAVKKLDLLGIGGNRTGGNDPPSKQSQEYELLLKKLNDVGEPIEIEENMNGFVRPSKERAVNGTVAVEEKEDMLDKRQEKKRRKEERKRKRALQDDGEAAEKVSHTPSASIAESKQTSQLPNVPPTPKQTRRLAHRAKFRASKNLTTASSTALSEILGIVPSSSPSTHESTPIATWADSTPLSCESPPPDVRSISARTSNQTELLQRSSTSVADYFAAKLKAKKQLAVSATTALNTDIGTGNEQSLMEEKDDKATLPASVTVVTNAGEAKTNKRKPVENELSAQGEPNREKRKRKRRKDQR